MESFDLENVNLDLLRRKCCFVSGQKLTYDNEYEDESKKKSFKSCFELGDIIPIQRKKEIQTDAVIEEEIKDATKLLPSGDEESQRNTDSIPDFRSTISEEEKKQLLSKYELIKTRKITYDKPILFIYNPSSGRHLNLVPLIETRLTKEKIPYEFKRTQKARDTYFFAKEIDLDLYSMLVAAGGDGSYHEVVNGMLARSDKKKVPIGMIPNGSGNDTCSSLGVMNLEDALNYIVNAEVLAIDTVRCLIDHDEYEQIADTDDAQLNYCRHMLINCSLAMPAKIANEAQKYKQCCGKNCYAVAALEQSILGRMVQDVFTIEVDGVKVGSTGQDNVSSILVMLFNGKFSGGGMIIDPFACMNDGLVDITWLHDESQQGLVGVADMLGKAKQKGGAQIFDRTSTYMRGRKIKINFEGVKGKARPKQAGWGKQIFGLDGEDLRFDRQLIFECIPGNVEFFFNSKSYFKEMKSFI